MYNLLFILSICKAKKYEDIFLQMLTHHMSHVGVSPMCLHTAVYRGVKDTFLYKDFKLSTGILIGLPKDLTFKTV